MTVRTHNTNNLIAEVSLLLKEKASEKDILRGLAVAHLCRDTLQQQQQDDRKMRSKVFVSYCETQNKIYSRFTSTKNRIERMTFRDSIVASAMESMNKGSFYTLRCVQDVSLSDLNC